MRISLLLEHFGARGGSEEYARQVAVGLAARGHRVHVAYEHDAPLRGPAWQDFVHSVEAVRIPHERSERESWLIQHVRATGPDALYVQNVALSADAVVRLGREVPIVRFVHDFRPVCLRISRVLPLSRQNCSRPLGYGCLPHGCSIGPGRGSGLPVSWNRITERLEEREACRRMTRILVASRFMRELLLLNGFEADRVHTIGLFCPAPVPAEPLPVVTPERLLYLGQVQRYKGLSVLLQAMRLMPGSVTLDVAGDGPWRARCEKRAHAWGIADRVRFHGWVDREQLPALLARVGMLVFPSVWNEPFGLAGLEAMAYGRPVVAFNVGGVSDWLQDGVTGVLVNTLDAESLARAIMGLRADPNRAADMGRRAHSRVVGQFTLNQHLDRLERELASPRTDAQGASSPRSV